MTAIPLKFNDEQRKRGLLLLGVFLFPLLFTSIIYVLIITIGDIDTKVIGNETEFAKIEAPKNRSKVKRDSLTISGTLQNPLTDNFFYLIEFREKFYWPKYYLGNAPSQWSKTIKHRAKKDNYATYQVVMVDSKLKNIIDDWFEVGKNTGKYPGFSDLSITEVAAEIRVKSL